MLLLQFNAVPTLHIMVRWMCATDFSETFLSVNKGVFFLPEAFSPQVLVDKFSAQIFIYIYLLRVLFSKWGPSGVARWAQNI